jgi:hypothetical protein
VHQRPARLVALRDDRRVEWVIMWTGSHTRTGFLVCRRVIDECRRTTTGCPGLA